MMRAVGGMDGRTPAPLVQRSGHNGRPLPWQPGPRASGNDVRRELILDMGDAVLQDELAFLEPLDLELIAGRHPLQCLDGGVEVAMLLFQPGELGSQLRDRLVVETPPHLRSVASPFPIVAKGGRIMRPRPVPGKAEPLGPNLLRCGRYVSLFRVPANICFRLGPNPMAHFGGRNSYRRDRHAAADQSE